MTPFIEPSADALVAALWRTSWQVALLVCLVLVLQALLGKHLSPRWRYGMWVVVVARAALFPLAPLEVGAHVTPLAWTVESMASLRPSPGVGVGAEAGSGEPMGAALGAGMPRHALAAQAPPLGGGGEGVPALVQGRTRPVDPDKAGPALTVDPAQDELAEVALAATRDPRPASNGSRLFLPSDGAPVPLGSSQPAAPSAQLAGEAAGAPAGSAWPGRLLLAWALGSGLLLALLVRAELRFQGLCRDLPELDDARLGRALARAAQVAGLGAPPRLVAASFVRGPAVTGLRRPVLLVPPGFGADLDAQALDQVLLHEAFHLRRHDVHANAGLAVVRALFWFHPLMHLALARLMGARESLRDWEALAATSATHPRAYAETLLHLAGGGQTAAASSTTPLAAPLFLPLLRRHHDLERRILMIARFDARSHRSWTLGLASCLAIGWLGFTAPSLAEPGPLQAPGRPSLGALNTPGAPSTGKRPRLRVERTSPEADWHRDLRLALDQPLATPPPGGTIAEQIELLVASAGANLIWLRGSDEDLDRSFPPVAAATPARYLDQLLDLFGSDLGWTLAYRSVVIGYSHELPRTMDLRIYDIEPLLELGYLPDDLIAYLMDFGHDGYEAWEREHASIQAAGPLLMVRNDYRVHDGIEALLARVLQLDVEREREAVRSVFAALDEQLVDVRFDQVTVAEALKWLAQTSGTPIGYDEGYDIADVELTLNLRQASVLDVLSVIALESESRLWEDGPQVWLGPYIMGRPVMRLYPLQTLIEHETQEFDPSELLMEVVLEALYVEDEGDDYRTVVTRLGDLLVVQATPSMHAQIANMLATIEQLLP
ncbi:MAG: M56 family metallopeptidase [Planctomycetota bacterium]|nr:M56 family metallopeptidase [Planctomycetota bacterium]